MAYMDTYPLYIKSVDYGDLDASNHTSACAVVTYADDSVVTYTTEDEIQAVSIQLSAQQHALAAGEVISYSPMKT